MRKRRYGVHCLCSSLLYRSVLKTDRSLFQITSSDNDRSKTKTKTKVDPPAKQLYTATQVVNKRKRRE